MRHQPGDAPVAVKEGVYPSEPMMRCCCAEYCVRTVQVTVHLPEAIEETRNGARADGNVHANHDISVAQLARNNANALFRLRVFDPQQIVGQAFTKAPMHLANAIDGRRPAAKTAA